MKGRQLNTNYIVTDIPTFVEDGDSVDSPEGERSIAETAVMLPGHVNKKLVDNMIVTYPYTGNYKN